MSQPTETSSATHLATRVRSIRVHRDLQLRVAEIPDADFLLERAIEGKAHNPYGGILWESALALARHMAEHPPAPGTRAMEWGCGTGLVSAAMVLLGIPTLASDVDPIARELTVRTLRENNLEAHVQDFDLAGPDPLPGHDLFVGADLLYEKDLARALARRTQEALARGAEVRLADPGRLSRPLFEEAFGDLANPPVFRPLTPSVDLWWWRANPGGSNE
jgi:predicted nicotinamide N-methyase